METQVAQMVWALKLEELEQRVHGSLTDFIAAYDDGLARLAVGLALVE